MVQSFGVVGPAEPMSPSPRSGSKEPRHVMGSGALAPLMHMLLVEQYVAPALWLARRSTRGPCELRALSGAPALPETEPRWPSRSPMAQRSAEDTRAVPKRTPRARQHKRPFSPRFHNHEVRMRASGSGFISGCIAELTPAERRCCTTPGHNVRLSRVRLPDTPGRKQSRRRRRVRPPEAWLPRN